MLAKVSYAILLMAGFVVLGVEIAYAKWRSVCDDSDNVVRKDGTPPS